MNICKRNKKVACIRWAKVHNKEREAIKLSSKNYTLKARICGYLAGDGSVMIRYNKGKPTHFIVRFFPDHNSLVKSYVEAFFKLYKKIPKIKLNKNFFSVICYSKVVVEDLLNTTNFGIRKWRAPIHILNKKIAKVEWLRAIYDSEAYVGKNQIKLQTINEKGISDIQNLLYEFDIKSKRYVYIPKNSKWSTVYILSINKKSEMVKFLNKIGFNHTAKLEKLKEYATVA